jgi:PAS domain S-box-containing protein
MKVILIVDDRAANRDFLTALLAHTGHRLLQAADGAEALALARAERPDLILADILMPTMDGYELVHQLRAEPALAATPVIFLTAHYHEHEAQALARACGVSRVLTKPCEPEVVLAAVTGALGQTPPAPAPATEEFDREHLRVLTDKLSQKAGELSRTNERLSALVELSLQLGSERNPRRLLHAFCHAARAIIGARFAVVGIVAGDGSTLRYLFTSGMDAATAARLGSPDPRQEVLHTVVGGNRTRRLSNPGGDPAAAGFSPAYPPIHSWLGAPIVSPSGVYGWLGLIDKIGIAAFSEEDERLAGILAAQVGRTYENGSLYDDIQRHAADLEREMAERLRAEEALREREEHIRLLLDSTAEAIYGVDLEGNCTFCNPACARLLGWAAAPDLLGRNMHALMHYQRADGTPNPVEDCRIYQAYRRNEGTHVDDEVFWRADGTCFPVEYWSHPIHRADKLLGAVVTFLDITERRKLEAQFRQAHRMEAVGKLAGGVAHDFNNLLTVITGYSEMTLWSLRPGDPVRDMIDQVRKAGERAATLTRQLLAFSRKQVLVPVVLDLNALLGDMEKMLPRLIGEDVDLVIRPAPQLWPVKADAGQIEQVVMNLTVNARDAMPQGGKLTIETANVELDETIQSVNPDVLPGAYALLAVSDTGCGMDAATKARIFEPFFTTKGPQGTGLGLATIWGIVKQSGGHIEVYTEVGVGTTFKIYLPRTAEQAETGLSRSGISKPIRGTETILLVEDEERVRALTRLVLQSHGYTVLEAKNGGEALVMAQQHPGEIHLLVSDVVMPNMSGRQLVERLEVVRPALKVLYVSGYTDDAVVRHGIVDAKTPFLQKPFSPLAFARKVREVLDRR